MTLTGQRSVVVEVFLLRALRLVIVIVFFALLFLHFGFFILFLPRVVTECGPRRVFSLLHGARPVLLNLGGALDLGAWADRVQRVDAKYPGVWELAVPGVVAAPSAVLIRPDGHVAWVGEGTEQGLREALTSWFGPASHG